MTNVLWYLKRQLCYDQTLINTLFSGPEFAHHEFDRTNDCTITADFGAIVVIPGRQCVEPPANDVPMLRAMLQRMKWAVVLITGDEESRFPFQELMLPNTRVWVMSPVQGKHDILGKRHLINGSQPHLLASLAAHQGKLVSDLNAGKDLDWFFAGQVTHPRREQCVRALRPLPKGKLIETKGFLQGIAPAEYYAALLRAKVVPCPSGPVELSTARIFEAIECGCVPVVDGCTPYPEYANAAKRGYWDWFFGSPVPFSIIYDWAQFPVALDWSLRNFDVVQGRIYKWWQDYKTGFRNRVMADVQALREGPVSDITVLISSSPIKSHPSTAIIEETIRSVRFHLPTAPIFIMQDGVRPEQADRAEDYALYMRNLRALKLPNVTIFDAPRFMHQATLTRWVLKSVESPMILFVEHDTPLVDGPDRPTFIDWPMLKNALMTEQTNHIRLHYDAEIHPDHQHMMRGHLTPNLIRCVQWHQRPHLARTRWYSDLLSRIFTAESVTFIEDKVYSPVSYSDWGEFKVTIYDPEGTGFNMKRSRDLDGRAGDPKFEMWF